MWQIEDLCEADFLSSTDRINKLYVRAGFNDEAKFSFLKVAVLRIPRLSMFVMYQNVSTYSELKRVINKYDERPVYSRQVPTVAGKVKFGDLISRYQDDAVNEREELNKTSEREILSPRLWLNTWTTLKI